MHVCFLNPVGTVGGAERVLLAWVAAARRMVPSARLSAVLFGDGPLRARLTASGVEVHLLALPDTLAATGDTAAMGPAQLSAYSWSPPLHYRTSM